MIAATAPLTTRSKPPAFLDTIAKKFWRETLKQLIDKGILDRIDSAPFAAMCEAYSEYVRALELLNKESKKTDNWGMIKITEKGNYIQHPLLSVKNTASERLLKIAQQFGMTPAARAKLAEASANAVDTFGKYT